ncbi:TetR/AcrR family transcriptional regulator [Miltoncostaea marina]|uniref:TetR/AcrR family transcriptional regulator n=1 Tax=Miltoncostaea marina TaxID=2843215 RepID=UPI001C3CEB60|nr:TetR/AcrR family transcriptional regulator [Miltoncostaea marina]
MTSDEPGGGSGGGDRAPMAGRAGRRRRADGERSREAILRTAASLATVEGITGLSLGRLADAVGMSKSGLFAHFGSKEELQLATVETACRIYTDVVVEPALAEPTGAARLRALADRFLGHVEDAIFPGGCFFASVAAEVDTQPGPVRDRALAFVGEWFATVRAAVADAQAEGALDPGDDPDQVAFELVAFLLLANQQFVAGGAPAPLDRARAAVERRLGAAPVSRSARG